MSAEQGDRDNIKNSLLEPTNSLFRSHNFFFNVSCGCPWRRNQGPSFKGPVCLSTKWLSLSVCSKNALIVQGEFGGTRSKAMFCTNHRIPVLMVRPLLWRPRSACRVCEVSSRIVTTVEKKATLIELVSRRMSVARAVRGRSGTDKKNQRRKRWKSSRRNQPHLTQTQYATNMTAWAGGCEPGDGNITCALC